jgi:hypothetical protein
MAESRGPAEARYQLPGGTYRELIVKKWVMPFLKKRLTAMRKLYELVLRGIDTFTFDFVE